LVSSDFGSLAGSLRGFMGALFFSFNEPVRKTVKMKLMCLAACALAALAFAPGAGAQGTGAPQDEPKAEAGAKDRAPRQSEESQQDRMRRCAHEAKEKELKGDERRSFMSACLRH
jgi:psiF repeat